MSNGQIIPEGWAEIEVLEAYRKGRLLVLLGEPIEEHNCDQMGCGSVSNHVIAYAEITNGQWEDSGEGSWQEAASDEN